MTRAALDAAAPAPRPWTRLALLAIAAAGALATAAGTLAWLAPSTDATISFNVASPAVNVPERATTVSGVDVLLVRQPTGEVYAFLGREPHAWRCPVLPLRKTFWLADEPTAAFDAGCTGSVFLADGTAVFGPSWRGLDRLPSRIEGAHVFVDVTRVALGPCRSDDSSLDCSTPDAPAHSVSTSGSPRADIRTRKPRCVTGASSFEPG